MVDTVSIPLGVVEPARRQRSLKPDEVDELVALYASGMSVNELAAQVKIHRTTVMARLHRREVKTRRITRKLNDDQVRRAVGLYSKGLSLAAVGAVFGVDAEVIRSELITAGIERRGPGRWSITS